MTRKGRKVVHNHSTRIAGLREALDEIARWPEVLTVVPGRISRGGRTPNLTITVQRDTESGLKCLAKHGSGNQDLYITTKGREQVRERLATFNREKQS